jgi:hypothetical protein
MRSLICPLLAGVGLLAGHAASAADLKSGPQPGESIGCLHVEWAVGGPDPGRTWTRPGVGCVTCFIPEFREPPPTVALVFVRKVDDHVVKLVKGLDAAVPEYGAVVCGVGDVAQKDLKKLEPVATNIPLTIASTRKIHAAHLEKWKLNPDAAVTVVVYGAVKANFAFGKTDELTKEKVAEIVKVVTGKPAK